MQEQRELEMKTKKWCYSESMKWQLQTIYEGVKLLMLGYNP